MKPKINEEKVELIAKWILGILGWSIIPFILFATMGTEMWQLAIFNPFNFVISIMFINFVRWDDAKNK